jgi:hypothetical protein
VTDTAAATSTAPDPAYRALPATGPFAPTLGHALITWVEPAQEHVHRYNRWYEDDHFITGCMVMPWMFSGRRYVAPRWLQHLRGPAGSRVADPLELGKYITIYWITTGRLDDHEQWSMGANVRLHAEGRGSCRGLGHDPLEERRQVFTAFHDHGGATYRDDAVPRAEHTLLQPYGGLVVELIDPASGKDRREVNEWLATEHLPSVVGGPVAASLRFDPRPLPKDTFAHMREVAGVEQIVTILHFLDGDPRECWDDRFAGTADALAAGGVASLAMQAAFVPTHHGTNDFVDELF